MCLHCKTVITDWRHGHTHGCHVHDVMTVVQSLTKTGCVKSQKECWTGLLSKLLCQHSKLSNPYFWAAQPFISAIFEFQNLCLVWNVVQDIWGLELPKSLIHSGFWAQRLLGRSLLMTAGRKSGQIWLKTVSWLLSQDPMGVWYLAGALKVRPLSTRKPAFCPHQGSNQWPSAPLPRTPFEEWQVEHIPTTTQRPACYNADRLKTLSKQQTHRSMRKTDWITA